MWSDLDVNKDEFYLQTLTNLRAKLKTDTLRMKVKTSQCGDERKQINQQKPNCEYMRC